MGRMNLIHKADATIYKTKVKDDKLKTEWQHRIFQDAINKSVAKCFLILILTHDTCPVIKHVIKSPLISFYKFASNMNTTDNCDRHLPSCMFWEVRSKQNE